jgi:hypothetical protein
MRKISFLIYHKLFMYFWIKGTIGFFAKSRSKKIVESKLLISWLRFNTKSIIKLGLDDLYTTIKKYDGKDTDGILQFPKRIKAKATYSYLIRNIGMGYHPTLKHNPISLDEVLKLNSNKKDIKWTLFLKEYLTYHWDNPDKCITKSILDKTLNK